MTAPEIRDVLHGLVGTTIRTMTGRPNRILRIEGDRVFVATGRSPQGQPVEISEVQAAADALFGQGSLTIDVPTVGYRSAFVGAVLSTLPGTRAEVDPRRIVHVGAEPADRSVRE